MRNRYTLPLVFALLFGCAFSKTEPPSVTSILPIQNSPGYELRVDWVLTHERSPDPRLKAIRNLVQTGTQYRSDRPITLPASIPTVLVLKATVASSDLSSEVEFLRGSIQIGNRVVRVPVELSGNQGNSNKTELSIQISGLNAAFRGEESSQGDLKIEVFSRSNVLLTLGAEVRTPPSHVYIEEIPIRTWEDSRRVDTSTEFLAPAFDREVFNLLRVVKLSNSEEIPIRIQAQRKLTGRLNQRTESISVSQAECSFTLPRTEGAETLSNDLYLVPLDARFISELQYLTQNPSTTGHSVTLLNPGESIELGIYATGEGADQWMNAGPRPSDYSTIQAVGSCNRRCVDQECDPGGRPGSLYQLLGCRCLRYENRPVYQSAQVGTVRGSVFLNLEADSQFAQVQFGDLDPLIDGEYRLIRTLSTQNEVSWLH